MKNFRKIIISVLRSFDYRAVLNNAALYSSIINEKQIQEYQWRKFNEIWRDAYNDIPFYERWKNTHSLPDQIKSLDELSNWPILTKKEIQDNANFFIRKSKYPDYYMLTGGSTGQPLRVPYAHKQYGIAANQWIGRAKYKVYPETRTFLIWGHHHLYGKGLKSYVKKQLRKSKDWIMNSYRVAAYDLSTKKMQEAAQKMITFCPEAVIGYSAAVLAFCRTNSMNQEKIVKLGINCIICSAGPLSKEEQYEISVFFNAPLCMEYGSLECGVMAYTNPNTSNYDVFWNTHLIETQKDSFGYKNIVTHLIPQYFTLIRYDIGDYFELTNDDDYNLRPLSVKTVIGRPSDIVSLPDGTSFWSNIIGASVKQVNKVIASQLYVENNSIEIHVVLSDLLNDNDINLIKNRCYTIVPSLKNIKLEVVEKQELHKTLAGKIPMVIYSDAK